MTGDKPRGELALQPGDLGMDRIVRGAIRGLVSRTDRGAVARAIQALPWTIRGTKVLGDRHPRAAVVAFDAGPALSACETVGALWRDLQRLGELGVGHELDIVRGPVPWTVQGPVPRIVPRTG